MQNIVIRQCGHEDESWMNTLYKQNSKQALYQLGKSLDEGFVQDNAHFDQVMKQWIEIGAVYAAEIEGDPVGFLMIQRERAQHGPEIIQYISSHENILILQERALSDLHYAGYGPVLVSPHARGKGVAKALHDHALHILKAEKFDAMVAFVDAENPTSLKIHVDALDMQIIDKVVLASGQFFIIGQVIG